MPDTIDDRILWLMQDFGGDLEVLPLPPGWYADAACLDHDPALWFPEKGQPSTPAVEVCNTCPVREPCLVYALTEIDGEGPPSGVFGGATPPARRELHRQIDEKVARASLCPCPRECCPDGCTRPAGPRAPEAKTCRERRRSAQRRGELWPEPVRDLDARRAAARELVAARDQR